MTNFELITQNPQSLEDFLEAVQNDALEAEGCSYDLKLPPTLGTEQIDELLGNVIFEGGPV